jgi:exopolysaccharide biosynthesis polyprenyl glycosylphosphotransferase
MRRRGSPSAATASDENRNIAIYETDGSDERRESDRPLLVSAPTIEPVRRRFRWLHWPAGRYLVVTDILMSIGAMELLQLKPKVQVVYLGTVVITFCAVGLYRSRLTLSVLDDLPAMAACFGTAYLGCFFLSRRVWSDVDADWASWESFTVLFTGLLASRILCYWVIRSSRRRGFVHHRVLILGAGHVGIKLAEIMQSHPEYGLTPVGLIDDNPRVSDPSDLPAPLLSGYLGLSRVLDQFRVRAVVIAFGTMREEQLIDVVRTCDRRRCEIMVVPRFFEMHARMRAFDEIRGFPLVRMRRATHRTLGWRLKRSLDLALCLPAVIILSPVMAACALSVRLSLGKGVLYRQDRVGIDGRQFEVLKFRTLPHPTDPGSSIAWTIPDERRPTRVGAFLRRASLDELPQLWNVIRGDMSLVGPRPERPHFSAEFRVHIPRYDSRYRVPAGLTGWAQVNGLRGDTSIEDRAAFDNYYIENWSLWFDIKILVRTVAQVLRGAGE